MLLPLLAMMLAAPLPKLPPPPSPKTTAEAILGTLRLDANGYMSFVYIGSQNKAVIAQEQITTLVDGKPVVTTVNITKIIVEPAEIKMLVHPKAARATDVKGEVVSEDDLKTRLAKDITVVRLSTPLDPEWRKFFADDVLFLEANGGGMPRPVLAPVAPLPAPPLPRPFIIK